MVKVVLTGGPSGGKTVIANSLQRELSPQSVVVPEAASMLFSGGFPRRSSPDLRRYQQRAIYFLQRELEGLLHDESPEKLLLCDRGSLDGGAYWPEGREAFLKSVGSDLSSELRRYHWVIHLDTASKAYYDSNNPVRIESYHQALELNQRVLEAWEPHPQRIVIPSTADFVDKIDLSLRVVRAILDGQNKSDILSISAQQA
jgi:hypothetical protein